MSASSTLASPSHWTRRRFSRRLRTAASSSPSKKALLCGGFGSAVLEAANDAGLRSDHIKRLGIPDHFIEHGERGELLADIGLDVDCLVSAAQAMAQVEAKI